MALNPQYIPLYQLQQYFVDKATGAPLAGGRVYFYSDVNRTIPKTVYELSSTTGTYTYVPLPNPIVLSSVGTPVDNNGNDIVIYAYPFDPVTNESELYYVVVQDALGRPQFVREAVPGISGSGTPSTESGLFNYVPNGQFLLHTDLPSSTDTLVAGSNIIAQGGFTVELPDPLSSVNTLTFQELGFTEDPQNSPRFVANFTCTTASAMDAFKLFRIKWNDVNKFSSNDDFYTFAFWAEGNVNIPISIQIYKYFGTTGSILPAETIFTDTITPDGQIHQYQFQFGTNEGEIVDLVDNNDYVALQIAFPTTIGFECQLTNFTLVLGQITLTAFPLQTNADMVTRGNDGWTDIPAYNGYDLYLPKIQTRYGYEYDYSQIGKVEATFSLIPSPDSPEATSNIMALDGSTYVYDDYSYLGIPYARLSDYLFSISPLQNVPLFGTGINYATAYQFAGDNSIFRLTVNNSGTGVAYAADGAIPTGFDFVGAFNYNGSVTGVNYFGYNAFSYGEDDAGLLARSNFETPLNPASPGTSGFSVSALNPTGGLYAFQVYGLLIICEAAINLNEGPGNDALYFQFSNSTTNFYIWYTVNGEVNPTPGGTGIQIIMPLSGTSDDVAEYTREAMSGYQATTITVTGTPPAGSYFTFQSNPGAIRSFYVWYIVNGIGSDPLIPGSIGISVSILSTDTEEEIVLATQLAINQYQYATPYAPGLFLRNYDVDGVFDLDYLSRVSPVSGIAGPTPGTLEYGQFISHYHEIPSLGATDVYVSNRTLGDGVTVGYNSFNSGGMETRPVNLNVNYYIRY